MQKTSLKVSIADSGFLLISRSVRAETIIESDLKSALQEDSSSLEIHSTFRIMARLSYTRTRTTY
jgi:hypothetical protein